MRTKTLNEIAQEAAKYAVETLDIERALVVKILNGRRSEDYKENMQKTKDTSLF